MKVRLDWFGRWRMDNTIVRYPEQRPKFPLPSRLRAWLDRIAAEKERVG